MRPLLNWIDTMFFGVRRILTGGVELPERPAINFVGATVTDNPAENRIDVSFPGVQQDGAGGLLVDAMPGGWVAVRPGDRGFRVFNGSGSAFSFVVDNGAAEVRVGYTLRATGTIQLGDVGAPAAPANGVTLASVKGALQIVQRAPPKITGSRSDPKAALKNLLTALANAGLIVDNTSP